MQECTRKEVYTLTVNMTLPPQELARKSSGLTLQFPDRWALPHPVHVVGTGSCVPDRIVSNAEVGGPAGVDDDWIRRKTGIVTRRWADESVATSDLAAEASRRALEDAGISAKNLALVVVATSTPDHSQPPTAAIVQNTIGAENAAAYDLNAVCSGFEFALNSVIQMVSQLNAYALVVGAEVYSRIINPEDRKTVILFGDGAGAVVVGPAVSVSPGKTILAGKMCTYGDLSDMISVPMGGTRIPFDQNVDESLRYFHMDGRGVREFVISNLPNVIQDFLSEVGVDPRSIRHFIPHQANGVMLQELADALGYPDMEQHLILEKYANTGAASIPMTLDDVTRNKALQTGDLVLMAGFGGGMSVGLTLLRW